MLHSPDGVQPESYQIRPNGKSDLRFKGWLLASVTTASTVAARKRWKEQAVYVTQRGKVVCVKYGRTTVPGEVDRCDAFVIDQEMQQTLHRVRSEVAGRDMGPAPAPSTEAQIINFFGRDPLSKQLFDSLGIDDVVDVDAIPPELVNAIAGAKASGDWMTPIDQIQSLESAIKGMAESAVGSNVCTAALEATLEGVSQLERTVVGSPGSSYIGEKIEVLRWHLRSLAGVDDGNGHSREAHHQWCLKELGAIEMMLNRVANDGAGSP